jgi:hypothetical protein
MVIGLQVSNLATVLSISSSVPTRFASATSTTVMDLMTVVTILMKKAVSSHRVILEPVHRFV